MQAICDIGVIGLAVMGENLILNMESRGYRVAVFNRTTAKVDEFLGDRGKGKNLVGAHSPAEFCAKLSTPRKILMMVKAGKAVDDLITTLLPHLAPGDILMDGGNSHFDDTARRITSLAQNGILYVGAGISGGEEGALHGPSIMPGGNHRAWDTIRPILQSISAKADDGAPCCDWVGSGGAGHYVKMVHNGIEYGDMQLICEAYHMLSAVLGYSPEQMADVFAKWNKGHLNSYLVEITRDIMKTTDKETGRNMIDVIVDRAGQKGTGKWTSVAGLDLGVPIPQIAEAVFARCMSAVKKERVAASQVLIGPTPSPLRSPKASVTKLRDAVFASKICSYAQGFQLLAYASKEYGWAIDYGTVAMIWRNGCIIRAGFLQNIKDAFDRDPNLPNLLMDPFFGRILAKSQKSWRRIVKLGIDHGVPLPSMSSALSYYDSYRCERLPANLLQALRDYFGAHTYERIDRPEGQYFHTDWTGKGGKTSSTTYTA